LINLTIKHATIVEQVKLKKGKIYYSENKEVISEKAKIFRKKMKKSYMNMKKIIIKKTKNV